MPVVKGPDCIHVSVQLFLISLLSICLGNNVRVHDDDDDVCVYPDKFKTF